MKRFVVFSIFVTLAFAGAAISQGVASSSASDPNIFVNLSKKTVPSVVNISTISTVKTPLGEDKDDLFRRFFEDFMRRHGGGGGGDDDDDGGGPSMPNPKGHPPKAMSLGSGFIIDSSGLILTNNHVVVDADEIKIYFTEEADEKPTDGTVVGRDPELDVALIKVKSSRTLTPLPFGDSDSLEVGEYVIAVGNPFGQGHSVTHGIISAKGRLAPDFPIANYLQTDAPINPGNSGGPLVNLKGEVIGINNAIDQRAQGIGFAIPINIVKKILPQLKSKGTVSRGYIGVLVNDLTPDLAPKLGVAKDLRAPFVTHVYPGDPADKAGVKPYDVILTLNRKAVHSSQELINAVVGVPVGETVPLKISRDGKDMNLEIKVSLRPGVQNQGENGKGKKPSKKKKEEPKVDTGMSIEDLTPDAAKDLGVPEDTKGAIVSSVNYGGPADQAGLARGDIIVEVDRKPIKDVDGFYAIVKDKKSYLLRVRRTDSSGPGEVFSVVVLDLKE